MEDVQTNGPITTEAAFAAFKGRCASSLLHRAQPFDPLLKGPGRLQRARADHSLLVFQSVPSLSSLELLVAAGAAGGTLRVVKIKLLHEEAAIPTCCRALFWLALPPGRRVNNAAVSCGEQKSPTKSSSYVAALGTRSPLPGHKTRPRYESGALQTLDMTPN